MQKAEILFSRGNHRDALELLGRAEKAAFENNRQDALAAIYDSAGNNLSNLGDFENVKKEKIICGGKVNVKKIRRYTTGY